MTDLYDPGSNVSQTGHHISDGRNIIPADQGISGSDIFFAAVQMSRMPMCLTDPHQDDNPIAFCNQAFEQLSGYSKAEIIGRNCRFLQGEGTDPKAVAEIRHALSVGDDVHIELLNYRKDGSPFWNALFISPVVDTAGNLVYHFASQLNVTRRREAEAVLQQSQRMETLGSMASSVAHEFNNLMTIVMGNLERLSGLNQTDIGQTSIDRAMWGTRRAAELTSQMLSFTRQQFHNNKVVDINTTLTNCDKILDQMAGSDVKVEMDLCQENLLVFLDASQLEMALLNLVRNASDAVVSSRSIVVTTRLRSSYHADGTDAAEIAVSDQGCGMSPEIARRALEPFFTTKPIGKGTGLGLSMVKGFVEQSSGVLEVETEQGVGTTIRMIFPLMPSF